MTPARTSDPYVAGLQMLARRELSTTQLRERLRRRGFAEPAIASALRQLQSEGAVSDQRTAMAVARQAAEVKMRGRQRALQEIQALGIRDAVAQAAVDAVYATVDERDLVERALNRRLAGPVTTPADFRRLYHALLRQGFEPETVVAVLTARRRFGR